MAYVVARPRGRFEIRESLVTPRGPRARSLANFAVLSEEVLQVAATRAERPFDHDGVVDSARRAGARVVVDSDDATARFVAASRRMAAELDRPAPEPRRGDPGAQLAELLAFADAVRRHQRPRRREPLRYPVLARLAGPRRRAR